MGGPLLLALEGRPTQSLSIFDPASPSAESIRALSVLVFAITGFIFLVVEGVLFYCVFRFRQRRAATTAPAGEPPQVYGSKPIEVAWTAAPTLIVFILVLVTARTLWDVDIDQPRPTSGDGAFYVSVTGHQWWWEYSLDHDDGRPLGVITANELHVPAGGKGLGRPVYLRLLSADVAHSYWVPRLMGKIDLIPGQTNRLSFASDWPDTYLGQCAEYCGTQHAKMLLRVVVEPPGAFQAWLENEEKPAADDPAVREGKEAFLRESCVNCHRVRGTPANGNYAPDLTHLMSRQTLAAGAIENDPDGKNLRRWVQDPQRIKPGCLMPAFGLDEHRLDLIVSYLRTLR